jgi:poly(3-hydroxybutyrate) depolymerase
MEDVLVILLHPYGGSAQQMYSSEGLPLKRLGYSLLIPQGYRNSWNAGACCGAAEELALPDSDFVLKLASFILSARFSLPPIQVSVFISGFSNGAFLASQLALEALAHAKNKPPWIHAVSLRSGYSYDLDLYASRTSTQNRISILALHGGADEAVHPAGCCQSQPTCCCGIQSDTCVSFDSTLDSWKERNQCASKGQATMDFEFFNFSTQAPLDRQCQAAPECGVYSCLLPRQGHHISNDVPDLIAAFFDHEYQQRALLTSKTTGVGVVAALVSEGEEVVAGGEVALWVWLVVSVLAVCGACVVRRRRITSREKATKHKYERVAAAEEQAEQQSSSQEIEI